MKRIVFHINYLLAGGIEKVLIELLCALDLKKYDITLLIGYKLDELEVLRKDIPPHVKIAYLLDQYWSVRYKKKKIEGKLSIGGKVIEELVLPYFKKSVVKKRLKSLTAGADVVVDFDMTLAGYHHTLHGVKKVAYCHFSFRHYWDGKKAKLDKLAARLAKYDKVVVLSDEMKDEMAAMYPALKNKMVRIYNAMDKQNIMQKATEAVDVSPGYFVSVGRLDERQKDFTTLIKGFAQYLSQYNGKEQLVIVGEGRSKTELELLVQSLKLEQQVIFKGFQSNPYKWIEHASLFIFCTKYEGLPTVLIEAHILKKSIIATASPTGIKELLMQGKAGILTERGDAGAICEAIHQLKIDEKLQVSFLKHAESLLKEFDIHTMVARFEKEVID